MKNPFKPQWQWNLLPEELQLGDKNKMSNGSLVIKELEELFWNKPDSKIRQKTTIKKQPHISTAQGETVCNLANISVIFGPVIYHLLHGST